MVIVTHISTRASLIHTHWHEQVHAHSPTHPSCARLQPYCFYQSMLFFTWLLYVVFQDDASLLLWRPWFNFDQVVFVGDWCQWMGFPLHSLMVILGQYKDNGNCKFFDLYRSVTNRLRHLFHKRLIECRLSHNINKFDYVGLIKCFASFTDRWTMS